MTQNEFNEKYQNVELVAIKSLARNTINNISLRKNTCNCTEDDYAIYDSVQQYKKALPGFYESQSETVLPNTGLEYAYVLNLEKKRLAALGLTKHIEELSPSLFDGSSLAHIEHTPTEYYNLDLFKEPIHKTITYRNQNAETVICQDENCDVTYHVLRSRSLSEKKYICPNCSLKQTVTYMTEGCHDCHTTCEPLWVDNKIIQSTGNNFRLLKNTLFKKIIIILIVYAIIVISRSFLQVYLPHNLITFLLIFYPLIAGSIIVYKLYAQEYRFISDVLRKKTFVNSYEPNNIHFPQNEFLSSTGSKIKALLYANKPEDIASFCKCDLTDIIGKYSDAFDFELGKYNDLKVSADLSIQYASLSQGVKFLRYDGEQVVEDAVIVEINLKKKKEYYPKSDYLFSTCPACKKTYNWFNSPSCPHCGEAPNYEYYDWVVTEVNTQPISSKKEMKKWF
ncbi:MAG: hypothetical protein E7288_10975 [Lachnospiraceae bacterium]|nr:hypothetical protein [Lachnospiraceae bacterium]